MPTFPLRIAEESVRPVKVTNILRIGSIYSRYDDPSYGLKGGQDQGGYTNGEKDEHASSQVTVHGFQNFF